MGVVPPDDPYTTQLLCQLFKSLEWVERASPTVTSDEAYDKAWIHSSSHEGQTFLIQQFHVIPHWFLFDFMSRLASQEMVDQHVNEPSDILVRAMQGAHSELLAAIESTYTSFLALHERGCLLSEALIGYDNILEDLIYNSF